MTPEEHRDAAKASFQNSSDVREIDIAIYHATMAVAEALLQMDICGHGTRGFCIDCLGNKLRELSPLR